MSESRVLVGCKTRVTRSVKALAVERCQGPDRMALAVEVRSRCGERERLLYRMISGTTVPQSTKARFVSIRNLEYWV